MSKHLNQTGQFLKRQLAQTVHPEKPEKEQFVNVANVGRIVSVAYEQLRNAAEYTQEHLLRQRAMRRYLTRNVSFHAERPLQRAVAEELVIELTQAGYLDNDTLSYSVIGKIHNALSRHYANYWRMSGQAEKSKAEEWALDLMSVEAEALIADDQQLRVYQRFAYEHYKEAIDRSQFVDDTDAHRFETSLYVAVHRALLKSDLANVRYDLRELYQFSDEHIGDYIQFHENITNIYTADLTDKLTRFIDRHGAPLRVLKAMIDGYKNMPDLLEDDSRFLHAYERQVESEYENARKRLNKGLLKSILFLFITKTLIGLIIEIPYDLAVTGAIIMLPLIINLVTPIIYLLVLRLGLKLPGVANTRAMVTYMDNALYGEDSKMRLYSKPKQQGYSLGFTVVYAAMFLAAFGVVVSRLISWEFNVLQSILFFIFLATASFLGFRLSHSIRELELVTAKPGVVQLIRDFFYMPFIILGRWLSEKYKRINFVALILDTAIELPLKTVLRLIRQWASFINDKKESL